MAGNERARNRLLQYLKRPTEAAFVLVGPSGVGKSHMVRNAIRDVRGASTVVSSDEALLLPRNDWASFLAYVGRSRGLARRPYVLFLDDFMEALPTGHVTALAAYVQAARASRVPCVLTTATLNRRWRRLLRRCPVERLYRPDDVAVKRFVGTRYRITARHGDIIAGLASGDLRYATRLARSFETHGNDGALSYVGQDRSPYQQARDVFRNARVRDPSGTAVTDIVFASYVANYELQEVAYVLDARDMRMHSVARIAHEFSECDRHGLRASATRAVRAERDQRPCGQCKISFPLRSDAVWNPCVRGMVSDVCGRSCAAPTVAWLAWQIATKNLYRRGEIQTVVRRFSDLAVDTIATWRTVQTRAFGQLR